MAGFSTSLTSIGFLALATLISLNYAAAATTRTRDLDAMNQLKQAWMPSVKNLNWEGDPCTTPWTGVTCNNSTESSFVTEINLMNRNIQGTIPPSISGLTDLITLEMSQNSGLIGEIPEEIGRLENLQTLSLQYCGLTGPLPGEIGNLRRLSFLGLNGNQFNGSIPPEVGHTNLTWFDISQNNFSGQIPVSSNTGMGVGLDNLTYIEHYHMFDNYLSGHIPAELFNPQELLHLLVNSNNLTGPLPNVTRFPPLLTVIRVDDNELVDNVPIGFEHATFVTELNIRKNQFSGPLRNFSRLRGLNFLDLSENNFDPEPFPSWVLSLRNIVTLRLASLSLSGTVPPAIFNGDSIQAVDLSSNSLSGTLSFSGTTGQYLAEVNLHNNNISGVAGQPSPLQPEFVLSLQGNPICLNSLIAFKNTNSCGDPARLTWTHPNDSSNTCDSLCRKHMQFNKYMCSCSYPLELEILLTAPTFTDLTNATSGLERDLAGNLGLETKQTYITDMRINDQQQVIVRLSVFPIDPAKDVNLPDATRTNITTRIQQHLFVLPQGPFILHDIILPDEHSSDKLSTAAIAGIVIGSLLGLLIVSGSIFSAIFYKRRADKAMSSNPFASWGGGSAEFGEAPKLKGARWFSLAELKTYTDNWSDYNQIGVGGYGRVYKGVLPTGDLVAIKRATEGSMQGANEFKNEIELLSRVHHRNLLSLIGFCYEGGEQALIYEFMSNGTLDDHLKGSKGDPLSWESRLAIALGSAKGIAYLHDHASPPIIHRDIKSPNILLNDRMVPKVADFGLSKLAPDEGDKLVQSVHVKGTLGYLDPEYYMTQILTDKSDVYSFGIVLLELLTSRPPIDMGKFVVREVRTALDKGGIDALRALLDPAIGNVSKAELEPYLAIALECVEENANLRPTISLVVKRLEALEMGEGVKAMDGRKVRYADEPIIINDAENAGLLKSRYSSSGAPERGQRQSDPFAYSGAYGVSATVKPK